MCAWPGNGARVRHAPAEPPPTCPSRFEIRVKLTPLPVFFVSITLKPRVEWYKSPCALNMSRFAFLYCTCSAIENCTELYNSAGAGNGARVRHAPAEPRPTCPQGPTLWRLCKVTSVILHGAVSPETPAEPRPTCPQGPTLWVVKVGGDDGELRPWHCIFVCSINGNPQTPNPRHPLS